MTKRQIILALNLEAHKEGGFFKEIYKSEIKLHKSELPDTLKAESYSASTSIYYLLGAEDRSSPHSLSVDETWHFYVANDTGTFVKLAVVSPDGHGRIIELGRNIICGQVPQFTIPAGWAMCARICSDNPDVSQLERNGAWVLCGATVAPGFEYADFRPEDPEYIASKCVETADFVLSCK